MSLLIKFIRDERGASAIEYAIIAVGIAVAVVTAVTTVGTKSAANFTNVSNSLK
jgi:pilus assembly protein Flp/PilA